jgi:hypothetical protein
MMAKYDWHLQNRIEINHFVAHVRATQISIPGFLFPTRDLKPERGKGRKVFPEALLKNGASEQHLDLLVALLERLRDGKDLPARVVGAVTLQHHAGDPNLRRAALTKEGYFQSRVTVRFDDGYEFQVIMVHGREPSYDHHFDEEAIAKARKSRYALASKLE